MVHSQTSMDWDDYRFFLTVARTPSIRSAAQRLGVSHSTVLRRVERLEDALGARLFERNTVGFRLTAAGEDVLQGVEDIEESVQSIDRTVTGRDSALEGIVNVSMPDIFSSIGLFPNLSELAKQFPNIRLKVDLSYGLVDLSKREADIAVRVTAQPPEDLVGRKVGQFAMAAFATQKYVDKHGPDLHNSDAKMIAYGSPGTWKPRHGFDNLQALAYIDDIMVQADLCKSHLGIASLPLQLGRKLKELVQISEPTMHRDIWVLYHTDLRYTSRVRAVRDFFVESLTQNLRID